MGTLLNLFLKKVPQQSKRSKSFKKESNDPSFELKICSRDWTLEALDYTLMDSLTATVAAEC